jgi:tetratricopeptide (TPR) repeat protein
MAIKDRLTKLSQRVALVAGNFVVLYVLVSEMIVSPVYPESKIQNAREQAVILARNGELAQAADRLTALLTLAPQNQSVWIDYLVVLNWQGAHDKAIALLDEVVLAAAPDYFFNAMTDSAMAINQLSIAQKLMQLHPEPTVDQARVIAAAIPEGSQTAESSAFLSWFQQRFSEELVFQQSDALVEKTEPTAATRPEVSVKRREAVPLSPIGEVYPTLENLLANRPIPLVAHDLPEPRTGSGDELGLVQDSSNTFSQFHHASSDETVKDKVRPTDTEPLAGPIKKR